MTDIYVQYGCGFCAPVGWLNFDASPTLRFERIPLLGRLYTRNQQRFPANVRYGDIVTGLPLAKESCRGVFCSHVVEHLSLEDAIQALRNSHRYLVREGIFRMVVPDLETLIRGYLDDRSPDAASSFLQASGLGRRQRRKGLGGLLTAWLGNSEHLWMWDERSLSRVLTEVGFRHVRRAVFGDSEDRRFDQVDDRTRFDGCLAIECRR